MKKVPLVLAVVLLYGCEQSSTTSNEESLVGTWVTEKCQQLTDGSGNSIAFWAKGEYTFTQDGLITWRTIGYNDSSCITGASHIGSSAEVSTTLAFEDLGTETLEDGLVGHRLRLQWIDGGTVTLDRQNIFAVVLAGNRLCTSESLRFGGSSVGYFDVAGTQVNYQECLTSGVVP